MKQQHNGLTLGKIRKFIEENQDLPDETPILTERVEDKYFEKNGWGVLPIKGYHYYLALRMNQNMMEEIKRREKGVSTVFTNNEQA